MRKRHKLWWPIEGKSVSYTPGIGRYTLWFTLLRGSGDNSKSKYDAKADLWSVGAILYQLVIGRSPFDGNSQLQVLNIPNNGHRVRGIFKIDDNLRLGLKAQPVAVKLLDIEGLQGHCEWLMQET
ncbi:hypothetical protein RJT34_03813 [Clitoria ternatea]|uniref:Protein kinase domain-containing protein n=1 Tax=Clitoria ternatea TaxID=43366 RepID=A0AAN9Q034_CLITE